MTLYTAPENLNRLENASRPKVFLGGSIESGTADEWQSRIIKTLKDESCILLNPKRKNWDNTWVQSIKNRKFKEQVLWELNALELSDIILIYFDPKTKAPISFFEMGLHLKDENKIKLIYCPKGFYRKGNVDVIGEMYGVKVIESEDYLIELLKLEIFKCLKLAR